MKMVILHDAMKTIQNGVFMFFLKKEQKLVFSYPKKLLWKKSQVGCFFKPGFFSTLVGTSLY